MNMQWDSNYNKQLQVQLEIAAADESQVSPADVNEIGRSIVDFFRESGYTVTPHYTGSMGGSLAYDVLMQIYHIIHQHEDLLAALFSSVGASLTLISNYNKQSKNDKKQETVVPIEITFQTVKDAPVVIRISDSDVAIKKLEELKNTQPNELKNIDVQKGAKIKVSVSSKKKHRSAH